jgi:hypothetical protein
MVPSPAILGPLERDYHAMAGMIMGVAPPFGEVIDAVGARAATERMSPRQSCRMYL